MEIYFESSLLGVGPKLGTGRMGVVAVFSCELFVDSQEPYICYLPKLLSFGCLSLMSLQSDANLHTTILTLKVGFEWHRFSKTLKLGLEAIDHTKMELKVQTERCLC